jgi:dephospho-CoA kinase
MIKIGITGGIGSGKSIVATLFTLHGIPVYNADEETKMLNNNSPLIRQQLTKHFGADLYNYTGELDKKKFANIIFNDPQQLQLANSIIHPEVLKHFTHWCTLHSNHTIVALEAAILFESNFHNYLDKVVTVYSPLNLRVERVSERDNVTPQMVESRIKHQMPEKDKIGMAEYVIVNDYENSLIKQVDSLIADITHSAIIAQ